MISARRVIKRMRRSGWKEYYKALHGNGTNCRSEFDIEFIKAFRRNLKALDVINANAPFKEKS